MEQTHPLDELKSTNRSLHRAQTESFAFRLHDGNVLVCNLTYDAPSEHEYRVVVEEGTPVDCMCPGEEHYTPACKHRVAVAIRDAVLDAAVRMQVATDGGTVAADTGDEHSDAGDCEERPDDCDCDALRDGVPCWPCYRDGRAMFEE